MKSVQCVSYVNKNHGHLALSNSSLHFPYLHKQEFQLTTLIMLCICVIQYLLSKHFLSDFLNLNL